MVIWPQIVGLLLVGYLTIARSFAYLGIPPLFIGEIVLGTFMLLKPRVALGTWVASLLRVSPLSTLSLTLFVFLAYGLWQVGRGVLGGSGLVYTLKFFVFNYYTLFMFLGMWIGFHSPDYMRKLIRVVAWVNGIYGILFLAALRYVEAYIPGSNVPLFSAPAGQTVVILGLLCLERDLRSVWFILLLNIIVTLVWQVRAEWLGLAAGILAWGVLTNRLGRVLAIGMAGLAVLGAIELAGLNLPGRTGDRVSLSENLVAHRRSHQPGSSQAVESERQISRGHGRVAGALVGADLDFRSFHTDARGVRTWLRLRPLRLAPAEVRSGQENWEVRTPHSVFYYALGYTGWVGVAIFGALQLAIVTCSGAPIG